MAHERFFSHDAGGVSYLFNVLHLVSMNKAPNGTALWAVTITFSAGAGISEGSFADEAAADAFIALWRERAEDAR